MIIWLRVRPVPQRGENIEALMVQIADGHLDKDIYTQQPQACSGITHLAAGL
jgi:hypothetical protein